MPKPHWSDKEIKFLLQNYAVMASNKLQELLPRRSVRCINAKAASLGLKKPWTIRGYHTWSPEEDNTLRLIYPNEPKETILGQFPHKTWGAIRHHTARLQIDRRTYFSVYMSQKAKKDRYIQHINLLAIQRKPNKPEQKLMKIIAELQLPYRYVGDGKILIGSYIPDFIQTNGKKHIIEIFGDYWHSDKKKHYRELSWHQTELGRMMAYSQFGYKTLVIWEHELSKLESVKRKLLQFEKG